MIDSMSGSGFAAMDQKAFGAQVVSKTLDYMNNSGGSGGGMGSGFAPVDKQSFGAAVVSKTLDTMNSGSGFGGSGGGDFNFQTSVLGAAFSGKGTIADMTA